VAIAAWFSGRREVLPKGLTIESWTSVDLMTFIAFVIEKETAKQTGIWFLPNRNSFSNNQE
jgi:hypothetical protein